MSGAARRWMPAVLLCCAASLPAQLVSFDAAHLPLSPKESRELGEQVRAGRWLETEALLFRQVRENPESVELRKALAGVYFRNERYFQAAVEYARVDRVEPLDAGSRFTLATAYIALDRRHWARRELETLAAADPRNPVYPHWLAGIYQHYQWFNRALAEAGKAIELDPGFSLAHDRLGQCLEALGNTEDALNAYALAERLAREAGAPSSWPSYHRGSLLRQSGRFAEALGPLEQAVGLDPENAEAQHELGLTLDRLDQQEEARTALEAAVRARPGEAKFHYALARVQQRLGDIEGARASFESFQALSQSEKIDRP